MMREEIRGAQNQNVPVAQPPPVVPVVPVQPVVPVVQPPEEKEEREREKERIEYNKHAENKKKTSGRRPPLRRDEDEENEEKENEVSASASSSSAGHWSEEQLDEFQTKGDGTASKKYVIPDSAIKNYLKETLGFPSTVMTMKRPTLIAHYKSGNKYSKIK
jgi:outer membrane biosynthesis protein TonB